MEKKENEPVSDNPRDLEVAVLKIIYNLFQRTWKCVSCGQKGAEKGQKFNHYSGHPGYITSKAMKLKAQNGKLGMVSAEIEEEMKKQRVFHHDVLARAPWPRAEDLRDYANSYAKFQGLARKFNDTFH